MNKRALIFNGLKNLAIIFGQEIPEIRLKLYTETLIKYDIDKIKESLSLCVRNCNYFPSLKQILDFMDPPADKKDEGNELAGAIISCIKNFGRYSPKKVYEFVGPLGKLVIQRFGGWELICNSQESELGVLRAQLRDLSISIIASKNRPIEQIKIPYQKERFKSISECFKQLQIGDDLCQ